MDTRANISSINIPASERTRRGSFVRLILDVARAASSFPRALLVHARINAADSRPTETTKRFRPSRAALRLHSVDVSCEQNITGSASAARNYRYDRASLSRGVLEGPRSSRARADLKACSAGPVRRLPNRGCVTTRRPIPRNCADNAGSDRECSRGDRGENRGRYRGQRRRLF